MDCIFQGPGGGLATGPIIQKEHPGRPIREEQGGGEGQQQCSVCEG